MSDRITLDKLNNNEGRALFWLNTFNEFAEVNLEVVQDIYNMNCKHIQIFQFCKGIQCWINLHANPEEDNGYSTLTQEQFQIITRTEIILDELRKNIHIHNTKNYPRE